MHSCSSRWQAPKDGRRRTSIAAMIGTVDRAFSWVRLPGSPGSSFGQRHLLHHRRRVVHFNVTDSPTAAWTAQQVVEAFPHDSALRFLIRDRDGIFGGQFRQRVKAIGLAEVLITPHSPWQNPFAERVIGTIRRELLDHVIVLNERHLRRRLRNYLGYYHASRTHLALGKDAPEPRPIEPPERGDIVAVPQVGGLHHRYIRCAA